MMTQLANGMDATASEDSEVEMDDVAQHSESGNQNEDNNAKPSFGDLIAAKSAKPISILDAFPPPEGGPLVPPESSKSVTVPSGISLSTVLTQALRTNDNNLLESCFHNTDTQIIRSTIQRMDSSLTGILIQKLAERLSSRPGRYGHLLVWVQWICVAHGGAIASQPEVVSKIKILYKVLNQRSKALDSLLLLKGKLDMLDAQLGLRRQLLAERGPVRNPDEGHVVYIEGEEEEDSDGSDEGAAIENNTTTSPSRSKRKEKKNLDELVAINDMESDGDEDMPMINGVVAELAGSDLDSDEEEEDFIQQREGGLVDDEAEESDQDSHPSDRDDNISEDEDISDDNEEDSEMNDFIDDGPIAETDSASEISLDKMLENSPPAKKHRQR
jgi:U3 small nucleolar RNA-associated protein 5